MIVMTPRAARTRPLLAAVAALAAAGIGLSGCAGPSSGATGSGDEGGSARLSVLTSFYPLQFLAEEIGGDRVQVANLTPRGGEPHALELAPATIRKVQNADVVVYLSGFQAAVDQALDALPATPRLDVAPAADLLEFADADGEAHHHEDDEDEDHGGDDDTHDEGLESLAGHSAHDGHDHGPLDPHFWLDPERFAAVAETVGAEFARIDPANADAYAARTTNLRARLTDLDAQFSDGLAQCESRLFVTSHSAFGYMASKYDLRELAVAGIDPEAEPAPVQLRRVSERVAREGITTIFYESSASAKVASVLAHDLGLTSAVLNPLESAAPIQGQSGESDYLAVMNQNLSTLRTALSCQ